LTQAPSSNAGRSGAPGLLTTVLAVGLATILVVGAVLAGLFAHRTNHLTSKPFSLSNSGTSLENPDVSKVKAVAEQFALRMDSLNSQDVTGYVKSVDQLLTTRCQADFNKTGPLLTQSMGKVQFKYKGFVRSSGITTMDNDSAVVLVAHDSQLTASGGQSSVSAYRWTLALRKINGKWLVDQFTDPDRGGQAC
jgi:Mce-associated membrane protein